TSEVERAGQVLGNVARSILSGPQLDDQALVTSLNAQLDAARAVHPRLSYALVRRGKVVASAGDAPREPPAWLEGPGVRGLVTSAGGEVLRVMTTQGDMLLALDTPVDTRFFASLESRTGIQFLSTGGRVETKGRGIQIEVDDDKVQEHADARQ